jgi:hypothetical protein
MISEFMWMQGKVQRPLLALLLIPYRSELNGHESIMHLLAHLYVHRSSSLWKIPENANWFKEIVISEFKSYGSKSKKDWRRQSLERQFGSGNDVTESNLARSIYRHIVTLTDANATRRLMAFFPRELLHAPSLSCDPLPPTTKVSQYDDAFFAGCEDIFAFRPRTSREREVDARNLARMIPDANVRNQLQVSNELNVNLFSHPNSDLYRRLFMTRARRSSVNSQKALFSSHKLRLN